MLKGLDPLLGPDLIWVLAAMGHGDDLALVDANHPAEAVASATTSRRLVRLPGVALERAAEAILSVFPLDDFEDGPVRRMEVVGAPDEVPGVQRAVLRACEAATGRAIPAVGLERFAFYAAARRAFAVVQVGDLRPYGCFLLRKGVLSAPERTP
jgi:L-fucose mutarotase